MASYEYDVFGALRAKTGEADTAFRYTGEQWDAETGFYYLRARYYDPATGRFVSKDPWPATRPDGQSLNPYTYVRNNPAGFVDPSGLWCPRNPEDCIPDPVEDFFTEGVPAAAGWGGGQLHDLLTSSYYDLNVTLAFPLPIGPTTVPVAITVGLQHSKEGGFHPYAGGGLGGPRGLSGSLTMGPNQSIGEGLSCSGQLTLPLIGPLAATVQAGRSGLGGSGSAWFLEVGPAGGSRGGAAVCYYVW